MSASRARLAQSSLKASAILWFITATIGQWIFVYYILKAYGPNTLAGNFAGWDDTGLISGYVDGDLFGNLMFALHVFLAAVVTVGGTLQLTPQLRKRFPALHRATGRVFLTVAVFLALGGLWMTWGRGTRLSDVGALGTSFVGVLILVFSAFTLRHAIKRQIDQHRRWAMRTFIVVNGVWFFRLGLTGWFLINQGPVGHSRNLDGPADIIISFACYLIPLAILELYQRAVDARSSTPKWIMTGVVTLGAGATALGVFSAYMMLWSPHL